MPMQSRARFTPGQATAWQSPYQVGGGGGGGASGFNYMSDLLGRQMAIKEAMAKAQLRQMEQERLLAAQQLAAGKQRAKMQSGMWARQTAPQFGRGGQFANPALARAWDYTKGFAGNMAMPTGGVGQAARMVAAMGGPQAAMQGMMQSGQILGGLGQQALAGAMPTGEQYQYGPQGELARRSLAPAGFEEGGRVPKTGTYKLHEDEIVLNKQQADLMYPKLPPKAKGTPVASYQQGTIPAYALSPMLDPDIGEQLRQSELGRGIGFALGTGLEAAMPTGDIETQPGPFQGRLPTPGMAPMGMPREPYLGISGLDVSEQPISERRISPAFGGVPTRPETEQETVKKYTLTGKPETEEERVRRLREDADRQKENARLQRSRARLMLTHADETGELHPLVKKSIQERQWIAQQYDKDAAESLGEAEQIEERRGEKEKTEIVARAGTEGQLTAAMGSLREREMEMRQEVLSDMRDDLTAVSEAFKQGKYKGGPLTEEAAYAQGIINAMGIPAMMIMAQTMGKSVQDVMDTIQGIAKAEATGQMEVGGDVIPVVPGEGLKLLWVMMGAEPPAEM